MTRWVAGLMAAGVVLAGAVAWLVFGPHPQVAPYAAVTPGSKWTYEVTYLTHADPRPVRVAWVATGVEDRGGVRRVTVEPEEARPGVVPLSVLEVSADGVRELGGGQPWSPPVLMLKLPVRPGARWGRDSTRASQVWRGETTAHPVEAVDTPAGRFAAAKVVSVGGIDGSEEQDTHWYAEVGLVKGEVKSKWLHAVKTLVSFAPGKPAP